MIYALASEGPAFHTSAWMAFRRCAHSVTHLRGSWTTADSEAVVCSAEAKRSPCALLDHPVPGRQFAGKE